MTESTSIALKDRFTGALVGSALGDAVGEIAFGFSDREGLEAAVTGKKELCYTDDTAMMIGLAESMIELGKVDPEHAGAAFHRNFNREPWRGYAGGPPSVFSRVEREGVTYTEAASGLYNGQGSLGNGAAMRVTPVGLVYRDDKNLYARVEESARATHTHPVGIDGAAVLAKLIALAAVHGPGEPPMPILETLSDFARTENMKKQINRVKDSLEKDTSLTMTGFTLGFGVEADRSVPMAVYSFLAYPDSFEDCLYCAALHSSDRDTVACMACAVSGAYLGIGGIPPEWMKKLESLEYILSLSEGLYGLGK